MLHDRAKPMQMLHDAQLYSIRSGTERSLFSEGHGVHCVTKRYAALASSLHVLMAGYDQDDAGVARLAKYAHLPSDLVLTPGFRPHVVSMQLEPQLCGWLLCMSKIRT